MNTPPSADAQSPVKYDAFPFEIVMRSGVKCAHQLSYESWWSYSASKRSPTAKKLSALWPLTLSKR